MHADSFGRQQSGRQLSDGRNARATDSRCSVPRATYASGRPSSGSGVMSSLSGSATASTCSSEAPEGTGGHGAVEDPVAEAAACHQAEYKYSGSERLTAMCRSDFPSTPDEAPVPDRDHRSRRAAVALGAACPTRPRPASTPAIPPRRVIALRRLRVQRSHPDRRDDDMAREAQAIRVAAQADVRAVAGVDGGRERHLVVERRDPRG